MVNLLYINLFSVCLKTTYDYETVRRNTKLFTDETLAEINQIDRRILKGEPIPHDEKIFSIFEKHTAVESAINGLNHTGLDKCRDRGLESYERYVAFGIVARNLFKLGDELIKAEKKTENRKKKYRATMAHKRRKKQQAT